MAQGDISRFTSAVHHHIDDTAGTTERAVREFISLSPLLNRFRQTPRLVSLFWGNLRSCLIVTDMMGIDHEWRGVTNFYGSKNCPMTVALRAEKTHDPN
jgi:hypothetical protein